MHRTTVSDIANTCEQAAGGGAREMAALAYGSGLAANEQREPSTVPSVTSLPHTGFPP